MGLEARVRPRSAPSIVAADELAFSPSPEETFNPFFSSSRVFGYIAMAMGLSNTFRSW